MFRRKVSGLASASTASASTLATIAWMLAAVLLVVAPASAKPTALVVEPIKDFETVPKGEHIEHAFEIRNEGNEPLVLTDVRPACGCTVTRFDKTIAPGGKGFVYADVDTISFDGVIAKSVSVFTNDPENNKIQLVIKADVRPYVAIDPGYARFSYVQGEPTGIISQTLWLPDGGDFDIVDVKAPYDHIKVRFHEAKANERTAGFAGKQWRVDVEIDGGAPVGALRDYVEITLDHPKQKKVLVAISGFVRPRQHSTPQELNFGELAGGELPREYTVTFTNFATDGIAVSQVETGIQGLEAKIEPADETGHRFHLNVRLSPEMAKGKFQGTLRIFHDDAMAPTYEIPMTGTVL